MKYVFYHVLFPGALLLFSGRDATHIGRVLLNPSPVTQVIVGAGRKLVVTYIADGVTITTVDVDYGADAVAPAVPAKDGYTQTAPVWDKDGKNITTDTEITAVYTINKYTVIYKADGVVVDTQTVEHGADAVAPAICQDSKAEEPTEETLTVKAHARKKKRTIDELAKNLPVEEIIIDLPESRLTCDKCGGTFKLIGKKLVRRELIIIPQSEKILEYYSCTYACDKCEKDTGFAHIITTRTPPPLMKYSLASPSTVADVMTKKYVDGVPLARQEKIWARQGVELSRATMANWVIRCAQSWLKPLYKHMKRQLLEQSVIHADETVVQVLKEDNKPAASESRMWLYASGEYSSQHIRIFEYQPDRSGKRPESFLKGFSGCLITDGYAGYNQVQKVTHCGCWAHARRKWREAMPDGATVKTSKAAVGFRYCTKLFSLEKKYIYADAKARKEYRQNVVLPLLEEYFAWLKSIHAEKGSKLEDAVRYSLNQKQQLMAFLDYGDVPISNNLAENAIRPFVV